MLTCSLLGNMAVTEPSCVPALQEVCRAHNLAKVTSLCLFACFKALYSFYYPFLFLFVAECPSVTQVDVVAKVREVMLAHRGSERVKSACQGTIVSFEAELTKAKLQDRYVVASVQTKAFLAHVRPDLRINTRLCLIRLSFVCIQCARSYQLAHIAIETVIFRAGSGFEAEQDQGANQGDSDRAKARLHHLREMSGHNVGGFSADMTSSLTSSTIPLGTHFSHDSVPSPSGLQAQFDHRAVTAALDPSRYAPSRYWCDRVQALSSDT